MPMYEFHCLACKTKFEELVVATADLGDGTCPSCSSKQVAKQLSAFSVGTGSAFGGSSFSSSGGDYGGGCATGGCCSGGSCGF